MAQPEFIAPDFVDDNKPDDIQERMMSNLPGDIDNMPEGFPYDFTMPSAIEKSELIEFHLVRALMIAFPEYAWGEWLDLHGKQVGIKRHEATYATGYLLVQGEAGAEIEAGTIFCVPAVEDTPAIEYRTDEDCVIGDNGTVMVAITAVEAGAASNALAGAITIMNEPLDEVTGLTNPDVISGGSEEETDDDYYDRLAAEYDSSRTYLGNDMDFKRWAQEAGAGDCVIDDAAEVPGTVKLVLVDTNGQPASDVLVQKVYDYIVSPNDRSRRLLPTACAKLICVAASTVLIDYSCTGLQFDAAVTSIGQIRDSFKELLKTVYVRAKAEGVLRYNQVRSLITDIEGVSDFDEFLMNESEQNITFNSEEYPRTGVCDFS